MTHDPWDDPRRAQQYDPRRPYDDQPFYGPYDDYISPGPGYQERYDPRFYPDADDRFGRQLDDDRHSQMLHERMLLDDTWENNVHLPPVQLDATFQTQASPPDDLACDVYPELQEALRALMQYRPELRASDAMIFARRARALDLPRTSWDDAKREAWKNQCVALLEQYERKYDRKVPVELTDRLHQISSGLQPLWILYCVPGAFRKQAPATPLPTDQRQLLNQLATKMPHGSRTAIAHWLLDAEPQARQICLTALQQLREDGVPFDVADTQHPLYWAYQNGLLTGDDLT